MKMKLDTLLHAFFSYFVRLQILMNRGNHKQFYTEDSKYS